MTTKPKRKTTEFVDVVSDQNGAAEAGMAANQTVAETHQPASGTPGAAGARTVQLSEPVSTSPPTSWSLESKAKWPMIPEHVRADILRWEDAASAEFKRYAGFKPFIREAEQRGKTPEVLLKEYMTIEDLLRLDPESGFRLLLRRQAADLGIPPHQFKAWAGELMADVARAAANNASMN